MQCILIFFWIFCQDSFFHYIKHSEQSFFFFFYFFLYYKKNVYLSRTYIFLRERNMKEMKKGFRNFDKSVKKLLFVMVIVWYTLPFFGAELRLITSYTREKRIVNEFPTILPTLLARKSEGADEARMRAYWRRFVRARAKGARNRGYI